MNGVTILEEHLCRLLSLGAFIGTTVFCLLMCCTGILIIQWIYKKDKSCNKESIKYSSTAATVIICIVFVGFIILQLLSYNDTHIEYTIKVDDSASFNQVYDKYEILSESDNIYRVKEK